LKALETLHFGSEDYKLRLPVEKPMRSFAEVLENRRSRYCFDLLSKEQLGDFLYFSARTKATDINYYSQVIQKRNSAAPGALHSIHCFLAEPVTSELYHYSNQRHLLERMGPTELPSDFVQNCKSLVDNAEKAWLVWYACDLMLLSTKYENAMQLALRECGNLAATQHLVAESLNLNFVQLGISGQGEAHFLSNQRKLFGVGMALVGSSRQ
jgi:SagB-type dehydrogenase family enzyme